MFCLIFLINSTAAQPLGFNKTFPFFISVFTKLLIQTRLTNKPQRRELLLSQEVEPSATLNNVPCIISGKAEVMEDLMDFTGSDLVWSVYSSVSAPQGSH